MGSLKPPRDHLVDEVIDDAVHQLARLDRMFARLVEAANGAGQARDYAAAAASVPLHEQHLHASARCSSGSSETGRATTDDKHIHVDTLARSAIRHGCLLQCTGIASCGSQVTSCGQYKVAASVRTCSPMNGTMPAYMWRIVISFGATARR